MQPHDTAMRSCLQNCRAVSDSAAARFPSIIESLSVAITIYLCYLAICGYYPTDRSTFTCSTFGHRDQHLIKVCETSGSQKLQDPFGLLWAGAMKDPALVPSLLPALQVPELQEAALEGLWVLYTTHSSKQASGR